MVTVRLDMKKENVKAVLKDGYLTISAVSAARNDEKTVTDCTSGGNVMQVPAAEVFMREKM